MTLSQRMSRLRKLLHLRIGPGAAILPKDLSKIQLEFAFKIDGGHRGARKVWRDYLPRLKYYNPSVSMVVRRTEEKTTPATMTLSFQERPQQIIDMKHLHESEILKQLLETTKAVELKATPEEEEQFKRFAELELLSAKHREQTSIRKESLAREERLLAQARGSIQAVAN